MFDVAPTELLLLGAVAVAVIPPKDLPRAMRFAGQWIGKARGMARHFRSGLDEMVRQAELDEIEQKWREENERIMREHPLHDTIDAVAPVMTALPAPEPDHLATAPIPHAAEAGSDAPLESAHDAPEARSAAADDKGPELPLGLPPVP